MSKASSSSLTRPSTYGLKVGSNLPENAPAPLEVNWRWQLEAACRGSGETFFPPDRAEDYGNRTVRENRAKAICARCAVLEACFQYALSAPEAHGVWGATTSAERARLLYVRDTASACDAAVLLHRINVVC